MKETFLISALMIFAASAQSQTESELKELVVSAPAKTQIELLPLNVTVVGDSVINNSTESSLLPVLTDRIPGMFVSERGFAGYGISNGAAGAVNIRGVGQGNKVLFMIDGQPQWASIFGHALPDTYVANGVERVEVVKGPSSLLYGSNAMGGSVNIITKSQKEDGFYGRARAMFGSFNTQKFALGTGYRKGKFGAFISGQADRYVPSSRLLGICHLCASCAMLGAWLYAESHQTMDFLPFFLIYLTFLIFYMPTLALGNATAFTLLKDRGLRPVDIFPRIRVWGTIGFVAAMWFVNCAYWHDGHFGMTLSEMNPYARYRFQYTPMMLLCTSVVGLATALYTLILPPTAVVRSGARGIRGILGLDGFRLFKTGYIRTFLLLAVLSGVCLQITNGFATPFISHFLGEEPYGTSGVATNATLLLSLSQISEAACVLLVGICMKRFGIRAVMITALVAWSLRFVLFAFGNPGLGLWMLVASMLVYGVAFNFFSIAGNIYIDQCTDPAHRGFGQGLLMLMTNGVGASLGTIAAGAVVNSFCSWEMVALPSGQTSL